MTSALSFGLQAFWLCVTLLVTLVPGGISAKHTNEDRSPGIFSLDVIRNPRFGRNGVAAYLKALNKYGAEIPSELGSVTPGVKTSAGEIPAWNQTYDREWLSPVPIGTPPQTVWLDIDTGSADLWVFTPNTAASSTPDRHVFDPNKSTTSSRINASWFISYGDGSYASGIVFKDQVTLGDVAVKDVVVESATRVSSSILVDQSISGLLGLAFNHSSTVVPTQSTLLQQLSDQHGVGIFTVDLDYHANGTYNFGSIDTSRYTGNISYQPVLDGSEFWRIYLTVIRIGGTNVEYIYRWPAIVDTGTTLILLPPDLVRLYWSEVPNARNVPSVGGWVFPCNQTGTLPDFIFGFNNDGFTASVPGKYMNYQDISDTAPDAGPDLAGFCYGGIQDNMGLPFAILGDTLLKSVFVVFDNANARIGFATKDLGI